MPILLYFINSNLETIYIKVCGIWVKFHITSLSLTEQIEMQKTVLILAGGKSQRFQSKPLQGSRVSHSGKPFQGFRGRGRSPRCGGTGGARDVAELHNKCLVTLNNKSLILHVIDNLSGVADEIIVAARDEQQGEQIRDKMPDKILFVFDSLRGFGPLAGVLAGLERASFPYSLVIGCDMPFVNESVVEFLFEVAERGNYDAVVPRWENGMLEPLHAVYKKEPTLRAIEGAIKQDDKRIFTVLAQLKDVNFLPVNRLKGIDPSLNTFTNINTAEDLKGFVLCGH